MSYEDLEHLIESIKSGDLVQTWDNENPHCEGGHILVLDNDRCSIWTESGCVFEVHPNVLLRQALDLLGIEHVEA